MDENNLPCNHTNAHECDCGAWCCWECNNTEYKRGLEEGHKEQHEWATLIQRAYNEGIVTARIEERTKTLDEVMKIINKIKHRVPIGKTVTMALIRTMEYQISALAKKVKE
jgi:hypothetical protein